MEMASKILRTCNTSHIKGWNINNTPQLLEDYAVVALQKALNHSQLQRALYGTTQSAFCELGSKKLINPSYEIVPFDLMDLVD
jgi:hypothetical protein